MDILGEVFSRLPYTDQYRLARVSRLYAIGLYRLRGTLVFWRICCERQGIVLPTEYSLTECEYYYYLMPRIISFNEMLSDKDSDPSKMPRCRAVLPAVKGSIIRFPRSHAPPFASFRVFNVCLNKLGNSDTSPSSLVIDTLHDVVRYNAPLEMLMNLVNRLAPKVTAKSYESILLLSLLYNNPEVYLHATQMLKASITEVLGFDDNRVIYDEAYNLDLVYKHNPAKLLVPVMILRIGYPSTSPDMRDYLIAYAKTLPDSEVAQVLASAARRRIRHLARTIEYIGVSPNVIKLILLMEKDVCKSRSSNDCSLEMADLAYILPAFDDNAFQLASALARRQ